MKTIELIVKPDGSLMIDAVGFHGADCEKATRFLEQALGRQAGKQKKPESPAGPSSAAGGTMTTLTFTPDGLGHGLYTEAISLGAIGSLVIERATLIELTTPRRSSRVYDRTGFPMFNSPSREACLEWERQYLESQEDDRHALHDGPDSAPAGAGNQREEDPRPAGGVRGLPGHCGSRAGNDARAAA